MTYIEKRIAEKRIENPEYRSVIEEEEALLIEKVELLDQQSFPREDPSAEHSQDCL